MGTGEVSTYSIVKSSAYALETRIYEQGRNGVLRDTFSRRPRGRASCIGLQGKSSESKISMSGYKGIFENGNCTV